MKPVNVKLLMDIEEVLLKADSDFRFAYSLDELIKSEKYLKEIGGITNLFFMTQTEYAKVIDPQDEQYKQKLVNYHNKLISDEIDININEYIEFIRKLSLIAKDKEYFDKINKILTTFDSE